MHRRCKKTAQPANCELLAEPVQETAHNDE